MDTTAAITVKVGRLPGTLNDVALESGANVGQALSHAGLNAEGYEVRVNGNTATSSTTLSDGDTVLLTRQIKGNQTVVRVGRLPGVMQNIALEDGSTVADALEHAELDSEGYEVRVNGNTADSDTEVSDGDTVLLTRQIKGN